MSPDGSSSHSQLKSSRRGRARIREYASAKLALLAYLPPSYALPCKHKKKTPHLHFFHFILGKSVSRRLMAGSSSLFFWSACSVVWYLDRFRFNSGNFD